MYIANKMNENYTLYTVRGFCRQRGLVQPNLHPLFQGLKRYNAFFSGVQINPAEKKIPRPYTLLFHNLLGVKTHSTSDKSSEACYLAQILTLMRGLSGWPLFKTILH